MLEFQIGADVAGRARIGLLTIEGVSVREQRSRCSTPRSTGSAASLRERYGQGRSSELPGAQDARALYKALGIDPTKTRPSSESLPAARSRARRCTGSTRSWTRSTSFRCASSCPSASTISLASARRSRSARVGPARRTRASARASSTSRVGRCSWTPQGPFGNPTLRLAADLDHPRDPGCARGRLRAGVVRRREARGRADADGGDARPVLRRRAGREADPGRARGSLIAACD